MNRLNDSSYQIDLSSDDYKYLCRTYDTYANDLKLYKVEDSTPLKDKFTGLLFFMSKINKNFNDIFIRTVDSVPGLRMYLLTHVVFDIYDNASYDWFISFMIKYLVPTHDEIREYLMMGEAPCDLDVDMTKFEYIPEFFDEVLIKIGMWRKEESGRMAEPIDIIETDNMDCLIVKKADFRKIMDSFKIIDLSVIEDEIVE